MRSLGFTYCTCCMVLHGVPKKISYFAWLKPYKVGNFFWDTVYIQEYCFGIALGDSEQLSKVNYFFIPLSRTLISDDEYKYFLYKIYFYDKEMNLIISLLLGHHRKKEIFIFYAKKN